MPSSLEKFSLRRYTLKMDIVLYAPEIPQNTGSTARTCAATMTPLHLIEPLGFTIDEKKVRRAGLDYWPWVDLTVHSSWEQYLKDREPEQIWAITKFGTRPYYSATFGNNDAILFGNETKGLPQSLRTSLPPEQLLAIPMPCEEVRSLNLSNAVAVVLYEARRQLQLDEPFVQRFS
jgi:tRNA (cytidine/uridine-2'-O-)-methyltransferase